MNREKYDQFFDIIKYKIPDLGESCWKFFSIQCLTGTRFVT